MIFNRCAALLISAFAFMAWAQAPKTTSEGLSTELKPGFIASPEKPFTYLPVDIGFWTKITNLKREKNWPATIVEGAKRSDKFGDTPEGREGQLALAQGLRARGFSYASFLSLTQLIKSQAASKIGEAALHELAALTLENHYDQHGLEVLLNSNEFGPLHPEIQSFVSMHRYLYNLRFGFTKWANLDRSLILPNSVWDWELRYWQAVGDVARDKTDKAEKQFAEVKDSHQASEKTKQWAKLQLARILFERAQFNNAHDLYTSIGDLGVREKGRLLLEVAWTKYYLKNYDKALGLLMALRAPYFQPSLTPERYVLESVIYRDLCHYEAVDSTVKKFNEAFHDSLSAIKKRKPLAGDRTIVNLALLDRDVQPKANLIDSLRREQRELSRYSWKSLKFFKATILAYKQRDKSLQRELDLVLESKSRGVAEQLLDAEEQIQFLDYTSKLDALRIVRAGEDRDYKSQQISYLTFESIFWPVDKEFWWDEFDDYKTLISSRCSITSTPSERKQEREFE